MPPNWDAKECGLVCQQAKQLCECLRVEEANPRPQNLIEAEGGGGKICKIQHQIIEAGGNESWVEGKSHGVHQVEDSSGSESENRRTYVIQYRSYINRGESVHLGVNAE